MKKIGDHMKEMGFNEKASDEAKKAFIKYLMRESQFHDRVTTLHNHKQSEAQKTEEPQVVVGEQLSLFHQKTGTG